MGGAVLQCMGVLRVNGFLSISRAIGESADRVACLYALKLYDDFVNTVTTAKRYEEIQRNIYIIF